MASSGTEAGRLGPGALFINGAVAAEEEQPGWPLRHLTAPTLIADGAADRLDPLANSHVLADLIPGAKLTLYPDAGHAFLFQDQAAFIPLIESFLG
jgi:pimeloyl-ACP methyl ester carboxylesterase